MFIVLFVLGILILVAGIVIDRRVKRDEFWGFVIGTFLIIVGAIGSLLMIGCILGGNYIDDKIEMYQNENAQIEYRIAETVNTYIEHESDLIEKATYKIAPESAITVVAAYPELNSSELVAKQIEIYTDNNAKIKELKEEKINLDVYRKLLYFGGD